MNVQSLTNEQLAARYNMTVDSNGFQAVDDKGRRHYLTDLRQKAMKEAKTKRTSKVKAAASKIALPTAEENLARLNGDFTEHQWFIRESQPGLDIEELGLRFYFIGGHERHQLNIRTKHFSNKELNNFYADKKILKAHKGTGSITIGSLSYDEVVEIANDIIEKSKNEI
ncbi:hypothetical protein phiST2_0306 [Vibrio phage phi-ST2]|uniref:Uncharacterized protein n=1 Tax=Vibrio phage phi-Grn1 TaxID=1747713 RepID=A0A126HGX7_9CAUD|nr:hypothetical protein phiGrn1_0175 [Vibrio phage phi-Grn1]ALP47482.1 hypothetical protein phiST2_0306 [Vibrio phage phi-ST2]